MKNDRRDFLRSALGASAATVLSSCSSLRINPATDLPAPQHSGIDHIVVVMMENRSFDHFFGWLPNALGKQAGLSYTDLAGAAQPTHALTGNYTGCGHIQPDHSYEGGRTQYNSGRMDGFLQSGNDTYALGYYDEHDLTFFGALARNYTTLDRYFCSFLGPTFPNRIFLHSGQTDRLSDTSDVCELETIWDSLEDANVSARAYTMYLKLWGPEYNDAIFGYDQYLADAAAGTLPAVSFVDPPYSVETGVLDCHPFADIRNGDAFLSQTYHALVNSPCWARSVLIVTFDEWGGFFDHVPPPRVIAPNNADTDLIDGRALLGLRVPTVIASPFSVGSPLSPRVNSALFDHTSVLKFIQWRFNLPPLGARDASNEIGNLATTLDFLSPRGNPPALPVAPYVPKSPCDVSVENAVLAELLTRE